MNHFYAQINRGHLRKAGGYNSRNVVKKKDNKDEDNSPKTLTDKNLQASSQNFWQLVLCDNTPSCPRTYQFLKIHFKSWPVIHLVVPIEVSHISLWPQEIQPREWEKKNKEQTNNMAWVNSKCKKGNFV